MEERRKSQEKSSILIWWKCLPFCNQYILSENETSKLLSKTIKFTGKVFLFSLLFVGFLFVHFSFSCCVNVSGRSVELAEACRSKHIQVNYISDISSNIISTVGVCVCVLLANRKIYLRLLLWYKLFFSRLPSNIFQMQTNEKESGKKKLLFSMILHSCVCITEWIFGAGAKKWMKIYS